VTKIQNFLIFYFLLSIVIQPTLALTLKDSEVPTRIDSGVYVNYSVTFFAKNENTVEFRSDLDTIKIGSQTGNPIRINVSEGFFKMHIIGKVPDSKFPKSILILSSSDKIEKDGEVIPDLIAIVASKEYWKVFDEIERAEEEVNKTLSVYSYFNFKKQVLEREKEIKYYYEKNLEDSMENLKIGNLDKAFYSANNTIRDAIKDRSDLLKTEGEFLWNYIENNENANSEVVKLYYEGNGLNDEVLKAQKWSKAVNIIYEQKNTLLSTWISLGIIIVLACIIVALAIRNGGDTEPNNKNNISNNPHEGKIKKLPGIDLKK